jgi:hypothetical protein
MNEAGWLTCTHPDLRLQHLDPWVTHRKLRLFTCACCRRIWRQHPCLDDLPILAHVLEEAGCTGERILDHYRGRATHTRGCWVLHLLLNKS